MKNYLFLVLVLMTVTTSWAADKKEAELLQKGKASFASGDYRRAVNAFESAARLNPVSTEVLHETGMCYLKLGANDVMTNLETVQQAVTAFTKALNINSSLPETRYQLGIAYLVLHEKQEAMKQRDALNSLDKTLAKSLSDRIAEYRPARKYVSVDNTGGRQPVKTRRKSGGQPAATPQSSKRFDGTVIMYGADWCPRCREAEQYMTEKGISFVYHNIDQDAGAKSDFKSYGGNGIPLIIIGSKKMRGFSAASLEYYLNYSR